MYIRLFSDIHNEFRREEGEEPYPIPELPTDPQTVLVLAGDIDTKGRGINYANALSGRFKAVVLVAGNHDLWGSNFTKLPNKWLEGSEDNVYPLFNAHITIDNVVFCGGTLWTDYNDCDELSMLDATRVMVDYSKIKSGERYRKFTPEMAYWDHKDCLKAIRGGLSVQGARKYIVVTHMTPSYINEDPKFYNQYSTTKHYYHSNLDDLVCDADVWCFGHTHHNVDRIVGPKGTRMVSNQVGYYPDHLAKGFSDTLLIEV